MPELSACDLQSRAQSALASSSVPSLRELTVEMVDSDSWVSDSWVSDSKGSDSKGSRMGGAALLISGSVSGYYHKQLAQELVRAVAGAIDLVNSVRVV